MGYHRSGPHTQKEVPRSGHTETKNDILGFIYKAQVNHPHHDTSLFTTLVDLMILRQVDRDEDVQPPSLVAGLQVTGVT